ncbi:hypothetical protein [Herbaspirillum sp. alder98]|uniref:hypothetical protein n=1 Tax=Herbaspirillum sp. alder98 TaxID=2913096 RepID=UPI001CD83B16|nr:hypothetical protein [Herbaspirillum sp. alder98]MCA1323863.1 hypothetical protein [Herbaspirillum sp. alder98]
MNKSRSPLADEYANATETNLDHARPDELERTSHAEVEPKTKQVKPDDEHPLSVGKP